MFSRSSLAALLLIVATAGANAALTNRIIRTAADPNNLPFSNDKLEGFENKIAELIAADLGVEIQYVWRAQRRGFFRETLKEDKADLVLGVPANFERALPTAPYYRSSYVFVFRQADGLKLRSFDDAQLRQLRIGVHLIGDDGANTPPAHALAVRGIITNVVGFSIYGNYARENPPAEILRAVAEKKIDVAVVWGPFAGYFAPRQSIPIEVSRPDQIKGDSGDLPMSFAIALGVRNGNTELRDRLNEVIVRRRLDIEKILDAFGVPRATSENPKKPRP